MSFSVVPIRIKRKRCEWRRIAAQQKVKLESVSWSELTSFLLTRHVCLVAYIPLWQISLSAHHFAPDVLLQHTSLSYPHHLSRGSKVQSYSYSLGKWFD